MRGGHHGFDCSALSLIMPPNFGSGAGSCLPSTVVVALGVPKTPVTSCAVANVPVFKTRTVMSGAMTERGLLCIGISETECQQ